METPVGEIDFDAAEVTATSIAMEAMTELFHRLPWGMEIYTSNGRKYIFKKFTEPRLNSDGKEQFGFDLKEENGNSHIEFTATRTGWGVAVEQPISDEET